MAEFELPANVSTMFSRAVDKGYKHNISVNDDAVPTKKLKPSPETASSDYVYTPTCPSNSSSTGSNSTYTDHDYSSNNANPNSSNIIDHEMDSVPKPETEENINRVEQLQNPELDMEDVPVQMSRKRKKPSHGEVYSCDLCEHTGSQSQNESQITEPVFIETSNISDETEIKKEENIDDPLSLIKIEQFEINIFRDDPEISSSVKQETDLCELDSKIRIEEDFVIKSEILY